MVHNSDCGILRTRVGCLRGQLGQQPERSMTVDVPRRQMPSMSGRGTWPCKSRSRARDTGANSAIPQKLDRDSECRDPPLPGTQLTGPCLSVIRLSDIRLTGAITLGREFGQMCAAGNTNQCKGRRLYLHQWSWAGLSRRARICCLL